jgi:hypothetical protein
MKIGFFIVIMAFLGNGVYAQAQGNKGEDELEKEYLIKAHKTPEYKKAFVDVHEINQDIKLAKSGLLKEKDVVKEYNIRLGGYMGRRSTIEQVAQTMKKKGSALLEMILLKSAARLALEDAAEVSN